MPKIWLKWPWRLQKKRVVLKWPAKGDPLPNIKKPSHQLMGKSTRYDVFMLG
ncbi:class I SAM-dependent methyltransferase [Kiloniella litopenaei]|uniref:class I SAM-dependent methyltransferase n=1 Tax=Kiloniella litopenaei TaxID=1549748 RepID=UPI003BA860C6